MRKAIGKIVARAFSSVITILPLRPGDVLIVYDRHVLESLAHLKPKGLDFQVPLIDAECNPGEEHEILRKLSFEEFNKVWNAAYLSYAEAQWKIGQRDLQYYYHQSQKSQKGKQNKTTYPLLRRFLRLLENVKLKLAERADGRDRKRNDPQSELTLRKPEPIVGKEEKQPSEPPKKPSKLLSSSLRRSDECLRVAQLQRNNGEVELAEINEHIARINRAREDEHFG